MKRRSGERAFVARLGLFGYGHYPFSKLRSLSNSGRAWSFVLFFFGKTLVKISVLFGPGSTFSAVIYEAKVQDCVVV
jgi:hypothetical protein